MYYSVEVKVDVATPAAGVFTWDDEEYMRGAQRYPSNDFTGHLALYLLERDGFPPEIIEPIKQWERQHPTVNSRMVTVRP